MSITIKHIEGNLAEGQPKEQTFGDSVDTITFGRERDCQVVYAPEYTVVGKRHCQLVRQVTGVLSVMPPISLKSPSIHGTRGRSM